MNQKFYHISYALLRDYSDGNQQIHSEVINKFPLQWIVEMNNRYKSQILRPICWNEISEKEYQDYKLKLL